MIFILLKHSTEHCKGQFSIIKRSLNSAPGFIQPFINSNLADMAVYCPHSSSCSQSIDCLWACIPKSYCPEWLQIQLTWVVKTFNGLWWAANQEQGNQVLLLTSAVLQNLQRLLITVFTDKHKTSADLLFLMFVSPVCSIRLFVSPSCFMLLLLSVWFNHQHWTVLLLLKKKKTKQWKSHTLLTLFGLDKWLITDFAAWYWYSMKVKCEKSFGKWRYVWGNQEPKQGSALMSETLSAHTEHPAPQ